MYLLITNEYPNEERRYNNQFIHTRVIWYLKKNLPVEIFVCGENKKCFTEEYEKVTIHHGNKDELVRLINSESPEKIMIHFIMPDIVAGISESGYKGKILVWFHGYEALAWYRRLFNLFSKEVLLKPKALLDFFLLAKKFTANNRITGKFLRDNADRIVPITVSEWMRDMAEQDLKIHFKNWNIIPNYIDTEQFTYKCKGAEQRYRFISVRSFQNRKYANERTVRIIKKLSKYPEFSKLHFTIYGDGVYFKPLTKKIKMYDNVEVHRGFLTPDRIAALYSENGFNFCPTRQDAQGVTMCEGMISGCIPITNMNTAIPEYADAKCSVIHNSIKQSAEEIIRLIHSEDKYKEKSTVAHKRIAEQCSYKNTIKKEIILLTK